MAEKNFDACEALVLYQLQKLLQTTMNGCLLQDRMFNDKRERLNEEQSRYDHLMFTVIIRINHMLYMIRNQSTSRELHASGYSLTIQNIEIKCFVGQSCTCLL